MNSINNYSKTSRTILGAIFTIFFCFSGNSIGASNYFSQCCSVTIYNPETDKSITKTSCATTYAAACDAAYKLARKASIAASN